MTVLPSATAIAGVSADEARAAGAGTAHYVICHKS